MWHAVAPFDEEGGRRWSRCTAVVEFVDGCCGCCCCWKWVSCLCGEVDKWGKGGGQEIVKQVARCNLFHVVPCDPSTRASLFPSCL
jgi:hypothetical protein